jgi:hypothetical protein
MGSESETYSQPEIAHVLFTDIVGYSKLPIDQQSELLKFKASIPDRCIVSGLR